MALFTLEVDEFVPGNKNVDLRVGRHDVIDLVHNDRDRRVYLRGRRSSHRLFPARNETDLYQETRVLTYDKAARTFLTGCITVTTAASSCSNGRDAANTLAGSAPVFLTSYTSVLGDI